MCGPGTSSRFSRVCVITGECVGSTATLRIFLPFVFLMKRLTPVIVPPVPIPATKASMSPSVSSQISGPVVFSWMAGFAGFSNCFMR